MIAGALLLAALSLATTEHRFLALAALAFFVAAAWDKAVDHQGSRYHTRPRNKH